MGTEYKRIPPEDLRAIQLIQLEMLIEVDRICKKNNIKYCITGGTVLGAVRHKGFIPWDDDVDVGMLRSEYEKFCKVCETDLDHSRFYLQNHVNTPGYRWGYGKIRRVGTEYVRQGQEHMPYQTGIFLDVFPLDNVPDNMFLRRIHNLACTAIRKTLWSAVGAVTDPSPWMRGVYRCLSVIPKNIVFMLYDRLVQACNKQNTKMVRITTFPTPKNGQFGLYKKWYVEHEELEFEGYKFPAPKEYDAFLTYKYGNYHEFPPEEERRGHPATRYRLLSKNNEST